MHLIDYDYRNGFDHIKYAGFGVVNNIKYLFCLPPIFYAFIKKNIATIAHSIIFSTHRLCDWNSIEALILKQMHYFLHV